MTHDEIDLSIIRSVLPETWTHVSNLNWLMIGYHLKLAGMNWRSLPEALARLEKAGLLQRDGYTLRRTPCR